MEKTTDVVVVGSCMIDLVCYAPRLPKSGETLRGNKFIWGFGGKGCNQCVAATKLGGNCLLVARIGNDSFGNSYHEKLLEYEIPRDFVKVTEGVSTGMAQITVADSGENHIVIVPGANDLLTETDVAEAEQAIISCKVLVCQLEIPENVTIAALKIKANSKKGKSILNAAPAHAKLNPLLYTLPDIFCVNETEAEILVGTAVTDAESAKKATKKLLSKGCKEVVVTLGEGGCVYGKNGREDCLSVPALSVNAVDTTGAGDAFVGALAFLLAARPELQIGEMLRKANDIATMSVQRVGTQDSFPMIYELPKEFGL